MGTVLPSGVPFPPLGSRTAPTSLPPQDAGLPPASPLPLHPVTPSSLPAMLANNGLHAPTTASATPHQSFTAEEVLAHKAECWLVIEGVVYALEPFLPQHPAGSRILLKFAGQDATKFFQRAGHSRHARQMMAQYAVGVLQT
eukprot:GGOE01060919.1.p3 GENE.GGOE01060919.1~~GGOE01060919.1.p3  ORF type:complete len:153 (+),score=38.04 GGOE01060919.1:36-461(+)